MAYDGAVIVGYGQTEYHKQARQEVVWYLADAIRRALAHAGIAKGEVDGLAVSSFMLPPDNTATVAEQLGMTLRWGYLGTFGGAEHVIGVLRAARAIQHEEADVVVVVAADAFTVERHMAMMNVFNTGFEYLVPYGMGGTNGLFAMLERRHRYEFGTEKAQLGKLAVTQRRNARRNPNALLRSPMTLDDYLNSRMIADPIRLYDCVLPCSGGDAVVLTSERRAHRLKRPPIRILAGDERTNYRPRDLIMLEGGWAEFSPKLFRDAGLTRADVDMLQLYDDYPIMEVIQIEGLGFCPKGEGGRFVEETDISLEGTLPINTGGGQLSCGQCGAGGGAIGLTEAVIQLQGEGGDRQVKGAKTALVTGFGMVGFVKGLCQSAVILTND
jgi:acetyl-CoA acetyltransferase